jgi:pimeloyl-ACP methyl ester carboxylesterase
MPKQTKRIRTQTRFDPQRRHPPETIELVDPAWILKALGLMVGLGLLGGYLTLCVVFARSQWQLVLHPSRQANPPAIAVAPLAVTEVRFGDDLSGQPQLAGWWVPGDDPANPTLLILHSGDGSLPDALPEARLLRQTGLNLLLFDYRGFGASGGQHPTESTMEQDAESALAYLTQTRGLPPRSIAVYATGVGASIAVQLCASHPELPALILDRPDGDMAARASADVRSRIVPFRLLFHQIFPLAQPLQTLPTPKLLISHTNGPAPALFRNAADPKTTVELSPGDQPAELSALNRFLGTYLPPKRPVSIAGGSAR